jgi:hypothetical protein
MHIASELPAVVPEPRFLGSNEPIEPNPRAPLTACVTAQLRANAMVWLEFESLTNFRYLFAPMTSNGARWKFARVAIVAIAMGILLAVHAPFMNGPAYWKWPWRRIAAWPYFGAMLLCAAPIFAAMFVGAATRTRRIGAIAMIMLSMFAMQVVQIGMTVKPFSLSRIVYFVESPMNTSYFSDAAKTVDVPLIKLLSEYPSYQRESFDMHSREKPPGPVLFFRWLLLARGVSDQTAMLAGILIGLLATLCVPMTYAMIRVLVKDRDSAMVGSAMIALCPGLILNFPMLDQVYAVGTCVLIIAWVLVLRTAKPQAAIGFGLVLAICLFVVYHFLVLGFFLGAMSISFLLVSPKEQAGRMVQLTAMAIAAFVIIYFAVFAVTGLNAMDCFRTALANQAEMSAQWNRPYPKTVFFDLTDFALGAAWIPWLLAIFALVNREITREHRALGFWGIAQLLIVAIAALLPAETARVWCFLLPLLVFPAAMELSRWPRRMQLATLAMIWLLLCLVGQNMTFMY